MENMYIQNLAKAYVELYCDYYEPLIVRICCRTEKGPVYFNEILNIKNGDEYYWLSDWYKCQKDVEYVGIKALSKISDFMPTEEVKSELQNYGY